ncbi:MAG TPA: DUF6252 family protein [Flavobacterium sp.]|nr:DUF6252 family protein [Flavobacterium sp.]
MKTPLMKKKFVLILTLSLTLFSCSSSDDDNPIVNIPENPEYAMTAKINGATFQTNNPFGNNEFSSTNIWSYYPIEDYVMLQGRQGILGNPEINIWLKRSDIVVGTYDIGQETFDTPPSHFIDLIDNSNDISENTNEGVIAITEVNTTTKMVKGTFQFTTVDELGNPAAPIGYNVTEGNFSYKYE